MHVDTGEIKYFAEGAEVPADFMAINDDDMTEKQKENMQVSKHDSRSYLGHLYSQRRRQSFEERSEVNAKQKDKNKAKRKAAKKSRKRNRK